MARISWVTRGSDKDATHLLMNLSCLSKHPPFNNKSKKCASLIKKTTLYNFAINFNVKNKTNTSQDP